MAVTKFLFTNGKMESLATGYKTFNYLTHTNATHSKFTTSPISRVAKGSVLMQSQFWSGQENSLNYSRIFPRRLYLATHTSSTLTVPFISLIQTLKSLETSLISIRSFTDGTASSSSTTSPSRLMALWAGIPSRPLLMKCSSSWLIAFQRVVLGTGSSLQFTRWLTINSNCTRKCQPRGRCTYMLSHTRASSIWRLCTSTISSATTWTLQCTYGIEQ